jgi:hypothetical protein
MGSRGEAPGKLPGQACRWNVYPARLAGCLSGLLFEEIEEAGNPFGNGCFLVRPTAYSARVNSHGFGGVPVLG